jgi:Glycosyl transferase family 2
MEISNAIVACMATFPARFDTLPLVVSSILDQVDALYVYVNQSDSIPPCLNDSRIHVFLAKQTKGDLSANGKIFPLNFIKHSYVVLIDDDFVFPKDYVSRLIAIIDRFGGRVIAGVHGSIFAPGARWYFERSMVYGWRTELLEHKVVQMLGSGCLAFHQDALELKFEDFLPHIMVDLTFAIKAKQEGLVMLAIKRPSQWIRYIGHPGLYQDYVRRLTWHTHAMRLHHPWSAEVYLDLVHRLFVAAFGHWDPALASRLEFDREVVHALTLGRPQLRSWGRTIGALQRRNEFLQVIGRTANAAG